MTKDIVTKVREKLTKCELFENTLYFGTAEWQEFEDFASKHWHVFIKSHQTNYLAATRIVRCSLSAGIYTSDELASALGPNVVAVML